MLQEPLSLLAGKYAPAWGDRDLLNAVLLRGFPGIPYGCYLHVVDTHCVQSSDNVIATGLMPGYYQRNAAGERRPGYPRHPVSADPNRESDGPEHKECTIYPGGTAHRARHP